LFALYGLFLSTLTTKRNTSENGTLNFAIDYKSSVVDVYARFTKTIANRTKNLDFLRYCGSQDQDPGTLYHKLASWAPNWAATQFHSPLPDFRSSEYDDIPWWSLPQPNGNGTMSYNLHPALDKKKIASDIIARFPLEAKGVAEWVLDVAPGAKRAFELADEAVKSGKAIMFNANMGDVMGGEDLGVDGWKKPQSTTKTGYSENS
jgi:hypothetical protein